MVSTWDLMNKRKRKGSVSWRFTARLPPELEKPVKKAAADTATTDMLWIEQAIRQRLERKTT